MTKLRLTKYQSFILVFVISSIVHELVVSIPLKVFGYWTFLAIMSHVLLTIIEQFINYNCRNSIVWLWFMFVPSWLILLYY